MVDGQKKWKDFFRRFLFDRFLIHQLAGIKSCMCKDNILRGLRTRVPGVADLGNLSL